MAGLYYEQFELGQSFRIFEHRGLNQRDELICSCKRSALMFRRPG